MDKQGCGHCLGMASSRLFARSQKIFAVRYAFN